MKARYISRNFIKFLLFNFILSALYPLGLYSQQLETDSIHTLRNKRFYDRRAIPYEKIPPDAHRYFMTQKEELINQEGYFLSPANEWICLGPTPAYMTAWSLYEVSGRVSCVAYDSKDETGQTIFFGGACGGVWKTTNGGLKWYPKSDFEFSLSSGSIAIDKNEGGQYSIVYYGTGEFSWSYYGCGLLKSTDGGESWTLIDSASGAGFSAQTKFNKIVIRPNYPQQLLAAMETGLFRSSDAGLHWNKVIPIDDDDLQCTDVVYSPDGNTAYAVGQHPNNIFPGVGYWISTNGGVNWTPYTYSQTVFGRTKIAVCRDYPDYVYILSETSQGGNSTTHLFISSDGGYNFPIYKQLIPGGWNGEYDLMLAVKPTDYRVIYYGIPNLYRSDDLGDNFCCIGSHGYTGCNACSGTSGGVHPDFHAFDFNPADPNKISVGCDGGVYISSNSGSTWFNTNTTMDITLTQFYRANSTTFNENVLFGGAQDIGMLYKTSTSRWNNTEVGDGGNAVSSKTIPDNFVFNMTGSIPGTVYYSLNGGVNSSTSSGIFGLYDNGIPEVPIVSHPTDPGVFFVLRNIDNSGHAGNINVFKSTDNGMNFTVHKQIPTTRWPQQFVMSSRDPNLMFVTTGTTIQYWHFRNHLWKTNDGGNDWIDLNDYFGDQLPDRYFSHVEIDPVNDNEIYLTCSGFNEGHVFKSTDGGYNWLDISGNLPNAPANDLIVHYSDCDTKNLLVATDAGVFISTNSGTNWQPYASSLPNSATTNLFSNKLACKLRVATFGRGVWECNLPDACGSIIIKDKFVINSDVNGVNINSNLVICSSAKVIIPLGCTIKMKEGSKIIIMDGGQIDASSGNEITLISQSGSWGGIEFQGSAKGTINNCNILASTSPITINGNNSDAEPINITNCDFDGYDEGPIVINNRNNVNIENCNWVYSNSNTPDVCAVEVNGSNNVYIVFYSTLFVILISHYLSYI